VHHYFHLRRALLALLLGALSWATLGPVSAHAAAPAVRETHVMGLHRRHHDAKQKSFNWSGYIRKGAKFSSASGSWTVPALTSTHDGYSSTWVGIDGASAGDGYLIQTGTEADVSGGRRSYRAWWEIITPTDPAPENVFAHLAVHPGDSISASVAKNASGSWTLRLRNNSTGHSASHTAAFAGSGSSAEWIQEDTMVGGFISAAPDWGSVTFRRLLLAHANPHLVADEAVDIVDGNGTREAATGVPNKSGNGFTVRWLATGSHTAVGAAIRLTRAV
jgi:hypothetical protein